MDSFEEATDALRAQADASRPPFESRAAPTPDHYGVAALRIHDGVLPDPHAYTAAVRARTFQTVTIGPVAFHGIAACDDLALATWITEHYPSARPRLTFYRESPGDQLEPNFIHSDRDMGDWTGILYLTEHPVGGDGTTFWIHLPTGATASTATSDPDFRAEWAAWQRHSEWEPYGTVPAQLGRLLLFPSAMFHSRAIFGNYGRRGVDARLTQIIFGTGSLERGPA